MAKRLTQIPGVGVIVSTMLVMKTTDPQTFGSGQDFAAWLGLTPKDHSGQDPARRDHPGR